MTNWTLFFTVTGVAAATAQLFRFVDLIERPSDRPVAFRHKAQLWDNLKEKLWMFWKS